MQTNLSKQQCIKMQFNFLELNALPHFIPQKRIRKEKKKKEKDLLTGRENILRSH